MRFGTHLSHAATVTQSSLSGNANGMRASSAHRRWHLFWVIVTLLYAAPLVVCVLLRVDFTPIATETLAYRYFFVLRILNGEGGNVWLPQGQLLSALQRAVYEVVDAIGQMRALDLRARLNLFTYLTQALLVSGAGILFYVSARSRRLNGADKILVAVVVLAPVYALNTTGFFVQIYADYLSVTYCLLGMAFYLVVNAIRAGEAGLSSQQTILTGVGCGLLLSNKITLVSVAALLFLVGVGMGSLGIRERVRGAGLMLAAAAIAITVVFLAAHNFSFQALAQMLPRWFGFVVHAGEEAGSWRNVRSYLPRYFGNAVVFVVLALGIFLLDYYGQRKSGRKNLPLLLGTVLIISSAVLFIVRRPAQSTVVEVFGLLIFCGAVLGLSLRNVRVQWWAAIACALFWTLVAALTFPREAVLGLGHSKRMADERWSLFYSTQSMAGSRGLLIVIPGNEYHNEGVHEMLLKAVATFPTWDIDSSGARLLNQFSPNTKYFHEYGHEATELDVALSFASVVVWFDALYLPALTERYPQLRRVSTGGAYRCETDVFTSTNGPATHRWWRCISVTAVDQP